mmetsp:Transcript_21106/g.54048  ORF Transcript_21106/g.54048 Transcript_21106/m.54048 type:complete len:87 (+) Transcript_21106:154-414(+)
MVGQRKMLAKFESSARLITRFKGSKTFGLPRLSCHLQLCINCAKQLVPCAKRNGQHLPCTTPVLSGLLEAATCDGKFGCARASWAH